MGNRLHFKKIYGQFIINFTIIFGFTVKVWSPARENKRKNPIMTILTSLPVVLH